jgi:hypothetical protein
MPALVGRRLTVFDIITMLYYEVSIETAIEQYSITLTDAIDAVEYCSGLKCKTDPELGQFCDGCLLRTLKEGWNFNRDDFIEVQVQNAKITISKGETVFFLGSLQEFEDSEFGLTTWLIAEEVSAKIKSH